MLKFWNMNLTYLFINFSLNCRSMHFSAWDLSIIILFSSFSQPFSYMIFSPRFWRIERITSENFPVCWGPRDWFENVNGNIRLYLFATIWSYSLLTPLHGYRYLVFNQIYLKELLSNEREFRVLCKFCILF